MDRRIKYTKKIIKDSFLELLEEKELKRITVSELCLKADINRATFYRYYLDIFDLFDKIQQDFAEELKNSIKGNQHQYTVASFCRGLLVVLLKEKKLAKIIFNRNNNLLFLNDILEIAYQNCYDKWKLESPEIFEEDVEYATIFIFNGALGIINYWIKNDFDKDIDEISKLIENISYYGVRKYIYKG